jgi:NAD(P)-dependent dehydrogenase (short-subunit alcohol dehydrogenase family)
MNDFAGKTVLVTGAAGGIGQALCRHFAGLGARIGALDKDGAALERLCERLRGDGAASSAVPADIADSDAVTAAVARIAGELGPVDVLVNNAGFVEQGTLARTTPDSWRREVEGNLSGAYHCVQAVLPAMTERGSGVIVNIGSVNGLTTLGHPAYSAAKAGLISLTKSLAVEYGPHGIRANVVCPGTVSTPVWASRAEQNPQIFKQLAKWYPLGRIVEPLDVAQAVAFLASDGAAAITGVVLPVDCGLMAGNAVMAGQLTLEDF